MFSWPNSQVGVMGAEQAANVLADVKLRQLAREGRTLNQEEVAAIKDPVLADYRRQCSAWHATSELWDDGIIDPADTRNALGMGLSAALNAPIEDSRFGTFRL
jgi:3-methylcrotonyl-CoA carboxylase beta subunit